MSLTKLGSTAIRFAHRQPIFRRLAVHESKPVFISKYSSSSASAKTNGEEKEDLDKPIRFSTSQAASWDPVASRTGSTDEEVLWYQPLVVMASTAIFLIYFCVLREENDVDEKLTWNLSDHFEGEARRQLEASQQIAIEYGKKRNVAAKQLNDS